MEQNIQICSLYILCSIPCGLRFRMIFITIAPTNVRTSSLSAFSVTVHWGLDRKSQPADQYKLTVTRVIGHQRVCASFNDTKLITSLKTPASIDNLHGLSNYSITVAAVHNELNSTSAPSAPINIFTSLAGTCSCLNMRIFNY